MSRDENLKLKWEDIQRDVSHKFGGGETLDLDSIIFLIGVQELGKGFRKFTKDEKVNVMHIAVCRLLEPFGYYEFDFFDDDGWPHYKTVDQLAESEARRANRFDEGGHSHVFREEGSESHNFIVLSGKFPNSAVQLETQQDGQDILDREPALLRQMIRLYLSMF